MQKIKNSLFFPKKIAQYANDKISKVILYLLFLLTLIILPSIVIIYTAPPIDNGEQQMIRESFYDADPVNCQIVNGEMGCEEDRPYLVNIDDLNVSAVFYPKGDKDVIATLENRKSVVIIMEKTQATVEIQSNIPGFRFPDIKIIDYSELEQLQNIDFTRAKDRKDMDFWIQFFDITSGMYAKHKTPIRIGMSLVSIAQGFGVLVASILMIAFLIKIFNSSLPITFGQVFKLVTYSYTVYAVCTMITVLYSNFLYMDWLINIGMFISVIYSYISTNTYLRNKMMNQ